MDTFTPAAWYANRTEVAELTEDLRRTHHALQTALESFPREDWERVGGDGGWSGSQIVEHIFLAQRVLCEQIRSHLQDPVRPELLNVMEQQRDRLFRYLPAGGKAQAGQRSTSFQGLDIKFVQNKILMAEQQFSELLHAAIASPIKVIGWTGSFFGELSAFL